MPPAPPLSVGNDVLDLTHPRCSDRPPGDRLLGRILAPGEASWLDEGGPPPLRTVRLWALWAAKEAAFKVLCKLGRGRRVFQPKALPCDLVIVPGPSGEPRLDRIHGSVQGDRPDERIWIEGTSDGGFVHVFGWNGEGRGPLRGHLEVGVERFAEEPGESLVDLRGRFTEAEWDGVRSIPSARVRLLARDHLESQIRMSTQDPGASLSPRQVEILTRRVGPRGSIPRVCVDGRDRPEISLSLSHHGRYLAWVILFGSPTTPRGADGTA